jgi:hypothetical protein
MKGQMPYHLSDRRSRLCLRYLCQRCLLVLGILCIGFVPGCVFPLDMKQLEKNEDVVMLSAYASKTPGYIVSNKQAAAAEAALLRVLARWADYEDGGCTEMLDFCTQDRPVRMKPCWGVSEEENRVRKESYERWVREYVRLAAANGRVRGLVVLLAEAGSWEELCGPIRENLPDAIREAEKRGRTQELIDAWFTYGEFSARDAAIRVLTTRIRTQRIRSLDLSVVEYRWEGSIKATLTQVWLDGRWVVANQEDSIRDGRYDELVRALQRADLWTTDPDGLPVVVLLSKFPAHKKYDLRGVRELIITPNGAEVAGVEPVAIPESITQSISIVLDARRIDHIPGEAFRSSLGENPLDATRRADMFVPR